MPVQRLQAFISYTSELKPECDAVAEVCDELKVVPFDYQKVAANGNSPREYVERELAASDFYLGILGGRHGSAYPPPADRSVVEYEFEQFRGQPGLRLTAIFHKQLPAEHIEPLQALFRTKTTGFESKVWKRDFDSIERLCNEVRRAITQFLVDSFGAIQQQQQIQRRKWQRVIMAVAAVCMTLIVITAIVSLASSILPREVSMVIICCLATPIIMSIFFLYFVL